MIQFLVLFTFFILLFGGTVAWIGAFFWLAGNVGFLAAMSAWAMGFFPIMWLVCWVVS